MRKLTRDHGCGIDGSRWIRRLLVLGLAALGLLFVGGEEAAWAQRSESGYNPGGGWGGGWGGGYNNNYNNRSNNLNSSSNSRRNRDRDRETRRERRRNRDSDSSSSSSSSRRNRSRAKTEEAKGAEGIAARARAQGKSNVVQRQGGGGTVSGGSKSGGGTSALPLASIKLPPAAKENTIYFTPTRAYVATGQLFTSSMVFFNDLGSSVDQVDLWVRYRPTAMEPTWVDTSPLERFGARDVEVRTWAEGYVRITARLDRPMKDPVTMLGDIHWKALAPTQGAPVEFHAPQGHTFGLLQAGVNVIKESKIGNQNRINQIVRVSDPNLLGSDKPTLETAAGEAAAGLPDFEHNADDRVRLAIVPAKQFVGTDEVSTADVVLVNPGEYSFDSLRLRIRYDPSQLKILDADENNYVTGGVNIWDGGFHADFPFDSFQANEVDLARGVIDYRASNLDGPRVYRSGVVARIVFRMQRQAGAARFWFESVDPLGGLPPTDVSSQGLSLLGRDEPMIADALYGTRIDVAPLNLREKAPVPEQVD